MSLLLKKINHLLFILLSLVVFSNSLYAQTPTASFTTDKITGCAPLVVNFTNTSTSGATFAWNFGNSNTSTIANPSTVYLIAGTYTATLIVSSNSGQKDTAFVSITVVPDPVANFTANLLNACEDNHVITFTNSSLNTSLYTWDFGDGTTSNLTNPTHTYTTAGTYNIRLVASNAYGCQDIENKSSYITINPKSVANFTCNPTSSCNVTTVFNFNTSATNASSWNWNFGDGTSSTQQNPTHVYSAAGAYTITLITTNSFGCKDTVVKTNYITIGNTLTPSFSMSDTAGCGPLTIDFTSLVSNATSWSWDLGDGTTSTSNQVTHTYNNPGSYSITLAVTTQSGCNGTITIPNLVIVDTPPIANFTLQQDSGCAPFTAQFINTSTGASTYNWVFDNGLTSTLANPTTIYPIGGIFNISLTATSANGCQSTILKNNVLRVFQPNANFTGAPTIGCPSMQVQFNWIGAQTNIVSWLWNFGDGTTSTLQNPTKVYNTIGNYNVYLVVTNTFGCKDTMYRPNYIKIVSGTVAYTVPDTIPVCQGKPFAFSDPTIGSNTWLWNFGNGTTSTIQNPSYTYNVPGLYTVTLATSMPGGCSQNFNPHSIINVVPYVEKPIDINVTSLCKPYAASFSTATANVTSYTWNFGDGASSTLANPSHIYAVAGTYIVTLDMTIGAGCLATLTDTVTFGYPNPMSLSAPTNCLGATVNFNMSNSAPFTSTIWNFGDGNTSILTNPTHVYAATGSYITKLFTTDINGCKDTFALTPYVVSNPIPLFTNNPTVCLNSPLQITNQSLNSVSYNWNFGDGGTSTDSFPTYTYTTSGTYTITLLATAFGCSKILTLPNQVTVIKPNADFSFTTDGRCMPVTSTFTDLSTSPVSWAWNFGDGTTSTLQQPVHTFNISPSDSVRLTIIDSYGCSASIAKKNIEYYAANASADNVNGCVPFNVQFTDNSIDGVSWFWDFGDGNTSTLQNPSNTYSNNGVYTVTLITTFPSNCKDTVVFTNMISVATPTADFFSPTVSGCSPSEITFVNTSTDAVSFLWDFGDGGTATNINPSHIYYIPGDYTIKLIATNSYGCSDTSIKVDYIHVPGTFATFSPSTTTGCQNVEVQFTDSSINAISWIWNFGDGFTALNSNPSHIYQDTGSYTVTLITFDSLGCTSSFTYPTPITIFQTPIANATVTNIIGCSPLLSNFTNLSQYATSYLWLFGDNDTSSSFDVSHSYTSGGLYQPQLIAITQNACRDTFSFSSQITAWQTPMASFQLSDSIICNPGTIQLQNTSSLLQNPNYSWDFGNGQTSSINSPLSAYNLPGNYSIQLSVINEHGCNDSSFKSITVNPSPTAFGTIDINNGCEPLTVTFADSSLGANNWTWNMGDGSILNVKDTSYLFSNAGTFNPYLVVSNSFGCNDTSFIQTSIEVYPMPNALFTASAVSGCLGVAIQFTDMSSNLNNPVYSWTIGSNTSNIQNPLITFTNSGLFDVTLEVTNDHGCKSQYFASQLIEIFDSIPPVADEILSVSVVNDTQTKITWKNSSELDLASYEIYRLNNSTLNYDLIYTELNPINSTTAFSSNYIDQGLNTLSNSYTYKVQTIDQCGNKLPLDSLEEHTSINIQALQSGQNIQVNWNTYFGCTVSNYELYRTQVSTGTSSLIATLPANATSFLDTTLGCPYLFSYKIIAKDLCGNSYISESDTSAATPENKLALQQVELIRSTVYNNREILTEWLPPTLAPDRVAAYRILRSEDDINYIHIATVPALITSYIDNTIDVDKQEYYYKILVINDCELSGIESGEGSSILLNGSLIQRNTLLNWTPYKQWIPGVNEYIIERQKIDGTWEQIKVVNGNTTATEVNE